MRQAELPKEGYIFQHKENKEIFARMLFLAEGESLDDYEQITEAEYQAILAKEVEAYEVN